MVMQWAMPAVLLLLLGLSSGCVEPSRAESAPAAPSREKHFDELVARYADLTYDQLAAESPPREYLEKLSFDPAQAKFYDEAVRRLQLTDAERELLNKQGFVSVDHDQHYSFGSLYFGIYSSDLPVLVTTDSILHAMHRTYDDLLIEMEQTFFTAALDEVLAKCHDALADEASSWGSAADNYADVDLYLTVARNLLKGAGAPQHERMHPQVDVWDGSLPISSKLDQDERVKDILKLVQSLHLQSAVNQEFTNLYGGARAVDFSQFKPRGHYTKAAGLARYFRTMMWLGRSDVGWNVQPPDRKSLIKSDVPRELRNAALLTQLLQSAGAIDRLRQMADILDFMIGENDSLTVFQLSTLLDEEGVDGLSDLSSQGEIASLQDALRRRGFGVQQIRSQVVVSNPDDLHQVPPPCTFQLFGQRFVIDSFVLSKVVFDSIIFDGKKVARYMPTGVDVMVALGNDSALPLLEEGMEQFPYAANLKASQQFIEQKPEAYWNANLYNIWLDALRSLNAGAATEARLPETMRTAAWQRKQLQTQLASWTQLRHNTVLYAKQSYTSEAMCEYPTGYVEPYPETYARIKFFANEAARLIEATDYSLPGQDLSVTKQKQVAFLKKMAGTLARLESLARKELASEPFTVDDQQWIKRVIDRRGGGSGAPAYNGWYSDLFYGGGRACAEWDALVVDVHTDPTKGEVMEQAVGNCTYLVAAIDNEEDRMIYVGPAYSYFEFHQPADQRLTNADWQQMLMMKKEPPRPEWAADFQPPKVIRRMGN
jgi:hypothetical protein